MNFISKFFNKVKRKEEILKDETKLITYKKRKKLHNDEGPAYIIFYHKNGNAQREVYYKEGAIHRINLPAEILYDISGEILNQYYYKNDKYHRIDGPAVQKNKTDDGFEKEYYYINGKEYTKEKFEEIKKWYSDHYSNIDAPLTKCQKFRRKYEIGIEEL